MVTGYALCMPRSRYLFKRSNQKIAMKVGIDIVHIPKLEKLRSNEGFMKKVFHPAEYGRAEHLAGIFAAKEAFFKAINKQPDWLQIEVRKEKSGRPALVIAQALQKEMNIQDSDVSISHEKDYAVATVVLKTNV